MQSRMFRIGSAAVVIAAFASEARADFAVYGFDQAGNLHEVDTNTQTDSMILSTGFSSLVNGVAYDSKDGALLYRPEGDQTGLYAYQLATGTQVALGGTALPGPMDDAAFYNGAYWYVLEGTNQIVSATIDFSNPAAPTVGAVQTFTLSGAPGYLSFGDIVITPSGTIYGSTTSGFFMAGLPGVSSIGFTIVNAATPLLQLSQSETPGVLYGQSLYTGQWYDVDESTGIATAIDGFTTTGLRDLSDTLVGTVPEPTSMALLGLGAAGLARLSRRRVRRA